MRRHPITKVMMSGHVRGSPERKVSSYRSAPLGIKDADVMADFMRYSRAFDGVKIDIRRG